MLDIAFRIRTVLLANLTLVSACGLAAACVFLQWEGASGAPNPAPLDTGFRQMYNLEFTAAHRTFEAWKEAHPEDPMGAASNAAAYLFAEFERMHVLEFDVFADKGKSQQLDKLIPDPKVKVAFEAELSQADEIATKILTDSSSDTNALFAKLLADGLRGDYAAMVEKRKRDALDSLKSSRSVAEKLIAIDPEFSDAYLAIGIENYVLGLRSAPTRWVLRLSGAETDRDKGIADLKITAEKGRYLAPYAQILLAIAAFRDHDMATARSLMAELVRKFPQNELYKSELARLQG